MSVHQSGFLVEWMTGVTWDDITAYVLKVSGDFNTSGRGAGFSFGDSSDASFTVKLDPTGGGGDLRPQDWAYTPLRVQFTVDSQVAYGGAGVILDWEDDGASVTFQVVGYKQLISTVRVYSPPFSYRPIATKTSASSIEDPTDLSYVGGPLNWLLWQSGGRPFEQAGSYASAAFYYSLSQAPIAPRYSWIAGEDGWEESLRLVRAAGGQLYQRPDGVVAYVSPLSIAGGASLFSLSVEDYTEITRKGSARDVVASYTTTYLPRILVGMQEIVSDAEPRVVAEGGSVTIELEPQYPIATLETATGGTQLLPEAISAISYDGTQVEQLVSGGYAHSFTVDAQRVTILIVNTMTIPFVIERITLRGTPIVPGEAGTVTVGSGSPTLSIEQNPYIQSRGHAQRLGRMALAFYSEPRPIISATGILYDPENHQVGQAGELTVAEWGLTDAPVVILGVSHSETGVTCDLELVETDGLPKLADYFLVQTASQSGETKRVGY